MNQWWRRDLRRRRIPPADSGRCSSRAAARNGTASGTARTDSAGRSRRPSRRPESATPSSVAGAAKWRFVSTLVFVCFVLFCFCLFVFFAKRGGTTHLGGRWRMMSLGRRMIVLSIWCSYLYRLGWRPRWRRTIKIQLTLMIRAYHSRHSSAAWPIQVVFCSVLSVEYFFAAHRLIRLRRRVIVHRIHSLAAIVIHFGPYLFRAIT